MAHAPRAVPAAFREAAATDKETVEITYAGHSTYYIDTPGGVRIATDYSGAYRIGRLPDVVTMNRAHSTHYTLFPDSRIPHVLHGWGENGEPARIAERIGDVFIRNVTTDIRRYFGDDSQRRDDQGRQFDLHLRGRRPLHRPSRAPAPSSSTTAISRRSAGSIS